MIHRTLLLCTLAIAVTTHACSRAEDASAAPSAPVPAAVQSDAGPAAGPQPVYRVPIDGLPSSGNPNALVTMVEFSDYQCPYCQRAEQTVARLRATYGDDLRVVIAEAPLPIHDRAEPAALAALAAGAEGKFDAMRASLFALNGALDDASLARAAGSAGLSLACIEADRAAAADALARSRALAATLGVRGAPTFFVGGRRVVGAQPIEVFRDVIDERLDAARALVRAGVRPADVYTELVKNGAASVVTPAPGEGSGCGGHGDCDENGPAPAPL
jgi:protein-disulfide isomerase